MTDLTTPTRTLVTLETYEARIDLYKEQVAGGYLGIGRTLIEAKASGVVPHGQWEDWATRTTGMAIRHVQRCMQVAREIDENSPLARLDMSKAMLLISSGLEEEKRDALGAAAAEEQVSVSELKRRIEAAREEAREQGRQQERTLHAIEVGETNRRHQQELSAIRRQAIEGNEKALQTQADAYRQMLTSKDAELADVNSKLATAVEEAKGRISAAVEKAMAESAAELQGLRARLDKADSDRKAAQQELLTLKSTHASAAAAGRDQQAGLTADRFARATRTYLMEVGELPYMGTALSGADAGTRDVYLQQLRRVADWLKLAQMALNTQVVEVEDDLDALLSNGLSDLGVYRA